MYAQFFTGNLIVGNMFGMAVIDIPDLTEISQDNDSLENPPSVQEFNINLAV